MTNFLRTPLMAANWKMHKGVGQAINFLNDLVEAVEDVEDREVLVCPPFVSLYPLGRMLRKMESAGSVNLGAQNMYPAEEGAYTGEISPAMLKEANCTYVIVGHSERRQYFGETDEFINEKVRTALDYGLRPILCVGEREEQRDAGREVAVVTGQVDKALNGVSAEEMEDVVIAYEPVWAIGTGKTATPQQANQMHLTIHEFLEGLYPTEVAQGVRIIYGGSVKPHNVDELMGETDIDGALVGGASLEVDSFTHIVKFGLHQV